MEPLALIALMALVVAAGLAARANLKSTIVHEYQVGLKFRKGSLVKTLETGKHWYFKPSTSVLIFDLRTRQMTVPGQEVLTSDHVPLKISVAVQYRVRDPRVAHTGPENYVQALYLAVQLALREIICAQPVDDLLALRGDWGPRLVELSAKSAESIGLELISAEVKDIMFSGPLKQSFSQVIRARNEGLAALEKARGETAALRKLANAARMVEKNPTLMQLRLLHSLAEAQGGTLVVNLGAEPPPAGGPARSSPE